MTSADRIKISRGPNPYAQGVQGQANQLPTVVAVLERAVNAFDLPHLGWTREEIWERLENNAPRVAVVCGSQDHLAHIVDPETSLLAAYRIWEKGGVPFIFGLPIICDAPPQSMMGMSYSLQSRNAVAEMLVNQMEGHHYHGAFVIQGCDKSPTAILAGLAHLDMIRRRRGDAPVFASFAPAHVLRGGTIPDELKARIQAAADKCSRGGRPDIAQDMLFAMKYILQCSSNVQFEGAFKRAVGAGLLDPKEHKELERDLIVNTCHQDGGVCAFYGTGNSSRYATAAWGMVHPTVEQLTEPAKRAEIDKPVDAMMRICDDPDYSVGSIVAANLPNFIRVHSATGGSTNLVMHAVAVMIYAGFDFSLQQMDAIRKANLPPDIFNYSLTEDRDVFSVARQCGQGLIRGMETIMYELDRHGVPLNLDAPTVTGSTWRDRIRDKTGLPAAGVTDNPVIVSTPIRDYSGIDVLTGNWLESAVVKISGMPQTQVDEFDDQVALVLYFENEDEANAALLKHDLIDGLRDDRVFSQAALLSLFNHNRAAYVHLSLPDPDRAAELDYDELFDLMVQTGLLKLAIVISGQGPKAFGMPEMFTPMQHINANAKLIKLASVISDGRYSGVTRGAAVGHVTPEAYSRGGILYLQTGDMIQLGLRSGTLNLIDPAALEQGRVEPLKIDLAKKRAELGEDRFKGIEDRRRMIAATNRLEDVTDAARGVVPLIVAGEANQDYIDPTAG